MPTAPQILESLRGDLAPLSVGCSSIPTSPVERGELARPDLRVFAGQRQRIIGSDLRSVALLVHRYGGTPSGAFFAAALETETTALRHLATLTRALGFDLVEIGRIAPLAGALGYTHFVAWLAVYGSDAEFATAFLARGGSSRWRVRDGASGGLRGTSGARQTRRGQGNPPWRVSDRALGPCRSRACPVDPGPQVFEAGAKFLLVRGYR